MSSSLPLLFDASGPVPTAPAVIQQTLIGGVADTDPGYTANLPGGLIEDISSTDVAAIVVSDQARVDAVNNVTPYGSNAYVLAQLGVQFGLPQGLPVNGSAYVVFTGTAGYVIPPGFIVSDGVNQYRVVDGGTVGNSGTSQPIYVVAVSSGTFPIPAATITTTVTTVPSPYALTVTNPLAGVPAQSAETVGSYRSRMLTAYSSPVQGVNAQIKTNLYAVPGVSPRLVALRQNGIYWIVICGGGDAYQTAGAIYQGCSDIGLLSGSTINPARNITASIFDAPDSYNVIFVNPPQQIVTLAVIWNTTLANFTAGAAVNQFIINAGQAYTNSIIVGQPINLLQLQEQIQNAVAPVLAPSNLTTLQFAVTINGVPVSPTAGTSIISSDPESYFYVSPSGVTSVQG